MADVNPLLQVHRALWSLLEASTEFTSVMTDAKEGNRIKYSEATYVPSPEKDERLSADWPEVRIVATGFRPHLQSTSSSCFLDMRWEMQVATNDQQFSTEFGVSWALYRALLDWDSVLTALTWEGKQFVNLCRPLDVEESLTSSGINQGTRGWTAMWVGETKLYFTTTDIRPE